MEHEQVGIRAGSATTNGTRCAIGPLMNCTSRDVRSSFTTAQAAADVMHG